MEPHGPTFTLAALFRATTLVAFALAWVGAVRSTPPITVLLLLSGLGVALGAVVGHRRDGSKSVRIGAAVGFAILMAAGAMYSACVADYVQDQGTDVLGEGRILLLISPFFGVIGFLLFRAWMFALYHRQIADGR